MERKCQRKPIRKLPSITRTPQRRIVQPRSTMGRVSTTRVTRSQPRLTSIPPRLIVTQLTRTGRANNTGRRDSPLACRGSDAPAFRGYRCNPTASAVKRSNIGLEAPELKRRLVAILAADVEG